MAKKVFLKRNEEKRINGGHLWIFSNEIREIQGQPERGDFVEVYDNLQRFLGTGFFNPSSLIAVRLLTRNNEEPGSGFWTEKLSRALEFRKRTYPGLDSFRAFFGESDGIPGLIADKYEGCLSVQFLSAGAEKTGTR